MRLPTCPMVTVMQNEQADKNFQVVRIVDDQSGGDAHQLHMRKLAELANRLDRQESFSKGQFLKWKPGLKNKTIAEYREPVIVRSVLPTPVFDHSVESANSVYFQEPLTILIGACMEDDLVEIHVDGRRFEPFDF